jgi:hypothetical protein
MIALLTRFLAGLVTFAAGLGAAKVLDKVAGDKLPTGTAPTFPFTDSAGQIQWMRVIIFIIIGAISVLLVKFIGQKLNVKILK